MALRYCTRAGGSGFFSSATVPTMSNFDVTRLSPVYDQDPGWLRNSNKSDRVTFYPEFWPSWNDNPDSGSNRAPFPKPARTSCGVSGLGDVVLTRDQVVAPMPSITETARKGCQGFLDPCVTGFESWIREHPFLAAGIALFGVAALFGGKK